MHDEIKICGTPEGYDAKIILNELNHQQNSVVHVARDDKRMRAMADALNFFHPDLEVFEFPQGLSLQRCIPCLCLRPFF